MKRRALLLLSCAVATARAQPRPVASEAIEVTGAALLSPRRFTPEDLAQLPPEAIGSSVATRGATGQESRTTVRGARLAALIERAGLAPAAREGRLMLEAPGDIRSGPRHVRNAMRVEVRPAP